MRPLVLITVVALGACSAGPESSRNAAKAPLTGRARDSAIAASRLPGAGAVGIALRSSDSAAARAARIDSAIEVEAP